LTITSRKAFKKQHPNSADKGSQLWLQLLVGAAHNRWFLDAELAKHIPGIGPGSIDWRSPLAPDFKEHRDGAFLAAIDLPARAKELVRTAKNPTGFWPARGPVWDALAVGPNGMRILVEAKAHIPEIAAGGTGASASSKEVINAAFDQVKQALKVDKDADWTGPLYQHANRLAHLWWLRQQGEDAHLVFLYFVNADDVGGPATVERWKGAIELEEKVLGVGKRHALRKYVHHVFFDVEPFKP
jgi:hypothetical protein